MRRSEDGADRYSDRYTRLLLAIMGLVNLCNGCTDVMVVLILKILDGITRT